MCRESRLSKDGRAEQEQPGGLSVCSKETRIKNESDTVKYKLGTGMRFLDERVALIEPINVDTVSKTRRHVCLKTRVKR